LPERRQRPVGNRPAGIVEALAVAPFPRIMRQGGCVKESSSQGQFPSRGSGGLADRPLGDQAAAGDWEGVVVDRRQLVPGRKRDDQITMTLQRAPCHDQAAICRAGEGRDGALDLAGRARRSGSHPPRARTPRPEWRRTERSRQDWRNPEGQPLADMWAHDPTLPLLTLLSPALAGLFLESNRVSPEIRGRNSGLLG
jgi:hypothetical protein